MIFQELRIGFKKYSLLLKIQGDAEILKVGYKIPLFSISYFPTKIWANFVKNLAQKITFCSLKIKGTRKFLKWVKTSHYIGPKSPFSV